MFKCDHSKLRISFNEFHDIDAKDMPEYGEFCLLELKDGRYTGGSWHPRDYHDRSKATTGEFIRGTADTIAAEEVQKWHSLDRYDMTNCLEEAELNFINLGPGGEGIYSVVFSDFQTLKESFPKDKQYCLLIMNDGGLAAGRWNEYRNSNDGSFIYAPALAIHSMEKVWAWTPLGSDRYFDAELEREAERKREEELNRNPVLDEARFKYGKDIEAYYDRALEKLKAEYPWASKTQMKKARKWTIAPLHGHYVFGQTGMSFLGDTIVTPWEGDGDGDAFIDFLCEYTRESVERSNPEVKFKYGMDIQPYLDIAFENVSKDYRWLEPKMVQKTYHYAIKQIKGDWEFVKEYNGYSDPYVCDCATAESFIESVEYDYQNDALSANSVVERYKVPFGHVDINGWNLEDYSFYRLKSGDYKVSVTAGDRTTGGSRDFFITPDCFEAKTYSEFLDRYLVIVSGRSFGLGKEDLLPNKELQKFLGY